MLFDWDSVSVSNGGSFRMKISEVDSEYVCQSSRRVSLLVAKHLRLISTTILFFSVTDNICAFFVAIMRQRQHVAIWVEKC